MQIKNRVLHNEVTIIGRVYKVIPNILNYNPYGTCVYLAVPNDDDYEEEPNYVKFYIKGYDDEIFKDNKGNPVAINGHIENRFIFQYLIADAISFI